MCLKSTGLFVDDVKSADSSNAVVFIYFYIVGHKIK